MYVTLMSSKVVGDTDYMIHARTNSRSCSRFDLSSEGGGGIIE